MYKEKLQKGFEFVKAREGLEAWKKAEAEKIYKHLVKENPELGPHELKKIAANMVEVFVKKYCQEPAEKNGRQNENSS